MVHSYLFCFTDQRNWWQRREESGGSGGGGTASASSGRGSEGRVARKPSRHRVANRPPDVFHREPTESGSKHLAALLLLRERGRPERRLHRLRDPQVRPGDPRSGGPGILHRERPEQSLGPPGRRSSHSLPPLRAVAQAHLQVQASAKTVHVRGRQVRVVLVHDVSKRQVRCGQTSPLRTPPQDELVLRALSGDESGFRSHFRNG